MKERRNVLVSDEDIIIYVNELIMHILFILDSKDFLELFIFMKFLLATVASFTNMLGM